MTIYNVCDTQENIVTSMKENNERICDCFSELANISYNMKNLCEIALNIKQMDRCSCSFNSLLDAIDEYAYQLKVLTASYEMACDVSVTLVNK